MLPFKVTKTARAELWAIKRRGEGRRRESIGEKWEKMRGEQEAKQKMKEQAVMRGPEGRRGRCRWEFLSTVSIEEEREEMREERNAEEE